jgi:hypothetical protein
VPSRGASVSGRDGLHAASLSIGGSPPSSSAMTVMEGMTGIEPA